MSAKLQLSRVGQVFGQLTITGLAHREGSKQYFHTQCSCGNKRVSQYGNIKRSFSCGCLRDFVCAQPRSTKPHTHQRNTRNPIYVIWHRLKSETDRYIYDYQCLNNNAVPTKLPMCSEWHKDFDAFATYVSDLNNGRYLVLVDEKFGYRPGNVYFSNKYIPRKRRYA